MYQRVLCLVAVSDQVTARVLAECGSRPGIGLVPPAGMHAEVKALGARRVTEAAAAGAGAPAGSRQPPRGSKPDTVSSVAAGQGADAAAVDDDPDDARRDDDDDFPLQDGISLAESIC